MLDMDESLRALYNAPVPLIILGPNRTIKMLNRPAETILEVKSLTCGGTRLESYLAPSSRLNLTLALNNAFLELCSTSKGPIPPVTTRVHLNSAKHSISTATADLSITAWFPTGNLFDDPLIEDLDEQDSVIETLSSLAPMGHAHINPTSIRTCLEGYFTILITPCSAVASKEEGFHSSRADISALLQKAAFENLNIAACALSKDGEIEICNQACEDILSSVSDSSSSRRNEYKKGLQAEGKEYRV
jgi:hypothetical protein